jgi:putative transposase
LHHPKPLKYIYWGICKKPQCELLAQQTFPSVALARLAVFEFIEGFYHTQRRHSALGYQSPAAYERRANACAA